MLLQTILILLGSLTALTATAWSLHPVQDLDGFGL